MKKIGIDIHALIGLAGLAGYSLVEHWSLLAGAFTATATGVYMCLRAVREWVKLRSEIKKNEKRS